MRNSGSVVGLKRARGESGEQRGQSEEKRKREKEKAIGMSVLAHADDDDAWPYLERFDRSPETPVSSDSRRERARREQDEQAAEARIFEFLVLVCDLFHDACSDVDDQTGLDGDITVCALSLCVIIIMMIIIILIITISEGCSYDRRPRGQGWSGGVVWQMYVARGALRRTIGTLCRWAGDGRRKKQDRWCAPVP